MPRRRTFFSFGSSDDEKAALKRAGFQRQRELEALFASGKG